MTHSPGHREHPEHRVDETPVSERVRALVGDQVIADSDDVVRVDEDGHPPRYYLARDDVNRGALQASDTTSKCPFKGHATYFTVEAGGETLKDAAWSYEDPYDEHTGLKDRIAFYDDKVAAIRIERVH
jgi:uncharacterized protein (DUF427 family)